MIRGLRTALFSASADRRAGGRCECAGGTRHARQTRRERARAGAADRSSVDDQVDVQLRRRLGHVRVRQLALRQSEGARRRREPERPVVRGLRQAGAVGDLHARVVERDLRQDQRRRRADLRLGAGGLRPGRLVVRARGSLDRMAIGQVVDDSARTRWTSSSAGRSTSWVTASCSSTARPKAAAAAATGPTRARRSSSRRSAASSLAPTRSKRSISTRTSSKRTTAAAGCGARTTSTRSARTRRSARPT